MEPPRLSDLLNFSKIEKQSDLLRHFLENGGTLQDILKFPEKKIDALYASGYDLYQKKDFVKARQTFALLTLLCPAVLKFWWALGGVQVALNDFQGAIATYAILIKLDPTNPQPHFFSAFCYQQLKDPKQAQAAFQKGTTLRANWRPHE